MTVQIANTSASSQVLAPGSVTASKNRRRGVNLKPPSNADGWVFGFAYRILPILVSVLPAWIVAMVLAAINGFEYSAWIFWISGSVAILPVIVSEAIRYRLYESVIAVKAETVNLSRKPGTFQISVQDAEKLEVLENTFSEKNEVYSNFFKRFFDLAMVILATPFVVALLAVIAILIALDGHSPFFRQERIGKDGKRFRMWKFRTMVPNSEERLALYLSENPGAKEEWDQKQKLTIDPRVTRFGGFLRKTSIDELPQILNVLMGDMSLVGPRPILPSQQALYPGHAYYQLRPGMTGLWQVSESNMATFASRAKYDEIYRNGISFRMDLRILARTVGVVLRGTGV